MTKIESFAPSSEEIEDKLLPEDFKLPDLSKLSPEEFCREASFNFPFNYNGKKIFCQIRITRSADLDNQRSHPPAKHVFPLSIRVGGFVENPDENPFDQIFGFTVYYTEGEFPHKEQYQNLGTKPFWNITYRMVEKPYRRQGYGELALRLSEEVIEKLRAESQFTANEIHIQTSLGALARLIVDKTWLKEHNLSDLTSPNKPDFHFIPHPADAQEAINLLHRQESDLMEISNKSLPDVKFIKTTQSRNVVTL
jgi:GNAT superfamily N-acetyltransferase